MSDDLDFDMEVVGDDDLDELGSDDASSLDDERRLVEAQSGETTAESTDPRRKRVKDNRSGSSSPESDLDDVESFPSEVDPFRFGDVPADWSVSLVGEIANGEKGLVDGDWVESKDMDEDGNIQLVQLGHIGEGQFKGQPNRFVNREFAKEEDCTILSEGDLLISRMQEPILRSCLLPDFECDSIMAVDIARLRENDDWNRICLKYLFNSRPIWKQGIAWASGTTRKRISRKNIEKIRLQKPPLPEQRKIASVLYAVDQAIQKTEDVIEQHRTFRQALINHLLSEGVSAHSEILDRDDLKILEGGISTDMDRTSVGRSPSSWERVRLSEVTSESSYGVAESAQDFDPHLPRYVRITDISADGRLKNEGPASLPADAFDQKYLLSAGDLLFARSGATVGKTLLYREHHPKSVYAGYLIRFVPDTRKVLPEYLFYYTQTRAYQDWVTRVTRKGAQENINAQEYGSILLPLPPLEEQEAIVEILEQERKAISEEIAQEKRLKRVKTGLMQDLLTGEVRTGDKAIEVLNEIAAHG